jgi:predicted CopG family antitoxin
MEENLERFKQQNEILPLAVKEYKEDEVGQKKREERRRNYLRSRQTDHFSSMRLAS